MSDAATARAWLLGRTLAAPPRLAERIAAAVDGAGRAADLASLLGEAALSCLSAALARPDQRAAALDLLAADALLTYGCEAAAESGPEALERFARDYGADRLAALVAPEP